MDTPIMIFDVLGRSWMISNEFLKNKKFMERIIHRRWLGMGRGDRGRTRGRAVRASFPAVTNDRPTRSFMICDLGALAEPPEGGTTNLGDLRMKILPDFTLFSLCIVV
ncbi:MAG TPA: hypothetical protein VG347_04450 [Verrucomicrobiae bacterium]|nr:hypothetical protein [Verrucomicrobiae bacterium]